MFYMPLHAALITTGFGDGADTFVDANDATGTNGTEARARVRGDSNPRKTYLRFDLSAFSPSGVGITDGSLTLTIQGTEVAGDLVDPLAVELWGINDGATGDALGDWSEDTLTWNNSLTTAQNDGTDPNGMAGGATSLGTIDVSGGFTAGNTVVFDDPALLTFLQGDTNDFVSFALTYTENEGTSFSIATKENLTLDAPTLQVIPEPSTLSVLVGLLSLLLFPRRRRG